MRLFFVFFIMALWMNTPAHAQTAGGATISSGAIPKTCNPAFYDTMNARAWMGGARDMEAAQKLIKGGQDVPSVVGMTDFSTMATKTHPFSGQFGPAYVATLVNPTLQAYLANFGKASKTIWDDAKCQDFSPDNFMRLQDLVKNDIRGCNTGRDKWDAAYKLTNPAYGTAQSGDAVVTYLDRVGLKSACANVKPIPTGITVKGKVDNPDYPDAICPASNCSYNGKTCN